MVQTVSALLIEIVILICFCGWSAASRQLLSNNAGKSEEIFSGLLRDNTYNIDYYQSEAYVSELESEELRKDMQKVMKNLTLSSLKINLEFDFPYFGKNYRQIIANSSGIYPATNWVVRADSAQIVPLGASYAQKDIFVLGSYDNGTALSIAWHDLKIRNNCTSFSTTLHRNGNIMFAYYLLPRTVNETSSSSKSASLSGIRDSYKSITSSSLRRKLFFFCTQERCEQNQLRITNSTIIVLTPDPSMPECLECDIEDRPLLSLFLIVLLLFMIVSLCVFIPKMNSTSKNAEASVRYSFSMESLLLPDPDGMEEFS